jgi:hypothetical protein
VCRRWVLELFCYFIGALFPIYHKALGISSGEGVSWMHDEMKRALISMKWKFLYSIWHSFIQHLESGVKVS